MIEKLISENESYEIHLSASPSNHPRTYENFRSLMLAFPIKETQRFCPAGKNVGRTISRKKVVSANWLGAGERYVTTRWEWVNSPANSI